MRIIQWNRSRNSYERINKFMFFVFIFSFIGGITTAFFENETTKFLDKLDNFFALIFFISFAYLIIYYLVRHIKNFKFPVASLKFNFRNLPKRIFFLFIGLNFVGLIILNILGGIYIYNTYFTQEKSINLCTFGIPRATESVVKISGEEFMGTGFWVSPSLILTNNHVVFENPRKVKIDGKDYEARIISYDTIRDLALIKLNTNDIMGKPLKFRQQKLNVAEDVYALGFPADLENLSITKGIASSIQKDPYDDRVYVQTDSAINPGNSGGPLLDYCGRVVGINTSSLLRNQNISFAIKYDQAEYIIDQMIKNQKTDTKTDIYPTTPEEVVASYYNTLSYGIFDKAYDKYFSARRKFELPRDNWIKGISVTYFIRLKSSEKTDQEYIVKVRFISTEFQGWKILDNEFEGTWTLVKEKGEWKMDESNIAKLN